MTAIEEARAALAKWDRSSFPDVGYAYLAESLRALIAEVERLSVPPTDDDREALAYLITAFRFRERGIPGRIGEPDLAIARPLADFLTREGFRRQGPITDDDREAAWAAHLRTKRNSRQARRSSFDAGWDAALRRQGPITDEAVDAARRAINEAGAVLYSPIIRAALEAAERARSAVPSTEREGERCSCEGEYVTALDLVDGCKCGRLKPFDQMTDEELHEAAAGPVDELEAVRSWFEEYNGTDPGPGGWYALEVNLWPPAVPSTTEQESDRG